MVKVILIDKGCNLKCSDIKKFEVDKIYKKCNLKKGDNFEKRTTWKNYENTMKNYENPGKTKKILRKTKKN